jgi:hypothetical protein
MPSWVVNECDHVEKFNAIKYSQLEQRVNEKDITESEIQETCPDG